jgi:peroxiredoxin
MPGEIEMDSLLIWIIAIATVLIVAAIIIRKKMSVGPPIPDNLREGKPLPEFSAIHEDGSTVHSRDLRGKPAVILFVRGNWCPFCSKQVEDLTSHYKEINSLGAQLIFVTPKPLETTRRVAEFFKVEFEFWLDESLEIARTLGLVLPAGVPDNYATEYGHDTVWPTALVVDKNGIIRYSKLSRLIFDRPGSAALLEELRQL